MRAFVKISLAAVMLVTSVPHVFCMCARATPVRWQTKRACPHCGQGRGTSPSRPDPCRHQDCRCGACETIQAVPPGTQVTVAPPDVNTGRVDVAPPALGTAVVAGGLPEEGWAAGPPDLPAEAGRALVIFLGHLLF